MKALLSLLTKLLLLFYQIRYSRETNPSQFWILEVQNKKWNALTTVQSVSGERFIAGFQFMQEFSRQIEFL